MNYQDQPKLTKSQPTAAPVRAEAHPQPQPVAKTVTTSPVASKALESLNQEVAGAIAAARHSGQENVVAVIERHKKAFDAQSSQVADALQVLLDPRAMFLTGVLKASNAIGELNVEDFFLPDLTPLALPSAFDVLPSRRSLSPSQPDSWVSESDIGLKDLEVKATEIN